MQMKKQRQKFDIVLDYPKGVTRTVKVKAIDRPTAERRALKFNPSALGVHRGGN